MLVRSTNLSQPSFWRGFPVDWGQGSRGIWAAGGSAWTHNIDYITISTPANSSLFGTTNAAHSAGTSGRGRGFNIAGHNGSSPWTSNEIRYLTIATTGNTADFGDLDRNGTGGSAVSNGTRALYIGGEGGGGSQQIEYFTIDTPGNSSNFGTIASHNRQGGYATPDATGDGFYGMTQNNGSGMEYVAIDTPGNTTTFGTLVNCGDGPAAVSNGSRAFWGGGYYNGTSSVQIEFYTWSTPGNATQYGRVQYNQFTANGVDDGSRGCFGGGDRVSGVSNVWPMITYFSLDLAAAGSTVIGATFGLLDEGVGNQTRSGTAAMAG